MQWDTQPLPRALAFPLHLAPGDMLKYQPRAVVSTVYIPRLIEKLLTSSSRNSNTALFERSQGYSLLYITHQSFLREGRSNVAVLGI